MENKQEKTRVLLVGVNVNSDPDFESGLIELASLAQACDMEVVGIETQNVAQVNTGVYVGKGKVEEIKAVAHMLEADMVIFDNSLSPMQLRNLNEIIERPVIDRTNLILEIFSTRARTREAQIQVETARLQYELPRLAGLGQVLSRQGGGTGGGFANKGAGEKKLELDRRKIRHRISELKKELKEVEKNRATQRKRRLSQGIPLVSLVGYTNAGKSTLMNALIERYDETEQEASMTVTDPRSSEESGMTMTDPEDRVEAAMPAAARKDRPEKKERKSRKVFVEDMLFATLDTTVRKISLPDRKEFLLSDTVGFINKLPHNLVESFRSTLEEVKYADLLLEVVDYSDENYEEQMAVTAETLRELGAETIPCIHVFNKCDLVKREAPDRVPWNLPHKGRNCIYMAAGQQVGLEELISMISEVIFGDYVECVMLIPYDQGGLVSYFNDNASILETEYLAEGTRIHMQCMLKDLQKYKQYVLI